MVNWRCGDSNSSVADWGPDSSVFTQHNCSLIRSGRPSFRDFEKIFRCAEEGHFKGQISQKWTNSAKFHVFSSPLLTKMSVFTPKMRDERGIFPKDSLLFASIPAGEGCKSPIEGREDMRVRPNGGIVVRQVENDLFFAKKYRKNVQSSFKNVAKIWCRRGRIMLNFRG